MRAQAVRQYGFRVGGGFRVRGLRLSVYRVVYQRSRNWGLGLGAYGLDVGFRMAIVHKACHVDLQGCMPTRRILKTPERKAGQTIIIVPPNPSTCLTKGSTFEDFLDVKLVSKD